MAAGDQLEDVMKAKVDHIRSTLLSLQRSHPIIPRHTHDAHFYEYCGVIYPSVTGITGMLDKPFLVKWNLDLMERQLMEKTNNGNAVTSMCVAEAKDAGKRKMNDAIDIGNQAHEDVEKNLNIMIGKSMPGNYWSVDTGMPLEAQSCSRAAYNFIEDYEVIPVWSELLVASSRLKTAGTLDLLAYVAVIDEPQQVPCDKHEYWQKINTGKTQFCCVKCGKTIRYKLAIVDWKTSNKIEKEDYVMQPGVYRECLKEYTANAIIPNSLMVVRLDKNGQGYQVEEVELATAKYAVKTFKLMEEVKRRMESGKLRFKDKTVILKT